jgi:hypothetical protein
MPCRLAFLKSIGVQLVLFWLVKRTLVPIRQSYIGILIPVMKLSEAFCWSAALSWWEGGRDWGSCALLV